MNSYYKMRPLYLETDVSGTGLGTGLLQVRDCVQTLVPNIVALWPTAFVSENPSSAETKYLNTEEKLLASSMDWKNSTTTTLLISQHNYRSQMTSSCIQKRHDNAITLTTTNPPIHSSIQNKHITQAWTRPFHCRLAIKIKLWRDHPHPWFAWRLPHLIPSLYMRFLRSCSSTSFLVH